MLVGAALGAMVCIETKMAKLFSGSCQLVHVLEIIQIKSFLLKKCHLWHVFLLGKDFQQPLLPHVLDHLNTENAIAHACKITYIALLIIRFDYLSNCSQNTKPLLVFVCCL